MTQIAPITRVARLRPKIDVPHTMPEPWRGIIVEELNAATLSYRDFLDTVKGRHHYMVKVRWRIWRRLREECGAAEYKIATVFGIDHTSVRYARMAGWTPKTR